jgi:hypothetical protein
MLAFHLFASAWPRFRQISRNYGRPSAAAFHPEPLVCILGSGPRGQTENRNQHRSCQSDYSTKNFCLTEQMLKFSVTEDE